MIPWNEILSLSPQVLIVMGFLFYLIRRDKEISKISERCHETQEAGHKAIIELTVAIQQRNGGGA